MVSFPFSLYTILGESMLPTFKEGDRALTFNWAYHFFTPKTGDLVVARVNGRIIIKKIQLIKGNQIFLVGSNDKRSTDSRSFGFVDKECLLGKVIKVLTLPIPEHTP